jgi:hypothetical protein
MSVKMACGGSEEVRFDLETFGREIGKFLRSL